MGASIRSRLREDSGVALVTVIGVISVLTIAVATAFYLAREAYTSTERIEAESQAFQVANAGIDTVYADLASNEGAEVVLAKYETTRTINVGQGVAKVKLEKQPGIEYVVTSTGHAADGTIEQVKVRFYYLSLWEMFVAAGEDEDSLGGGAIDGNASVDGPFYVRGDLAGTGTTSFTRGPLFVTGDISMKGNFSIGTAAQPIDVFVGGTYPAGGKNFYARHVSNSVPKITAPPLDDAFLDAAVSKAKTESCDDVQGTPEFEDATTNKETALGSGDASTYSSALPGWTRPKAAGASTWYKYVGPEQGRSAIGHGETNLVIGGKGSWGSWENDGHGYTAGQWDDFAFDDDNNILYVEGTVFIDGNVTFNENIRYRGNGALVVNGDVTVNGQLVPYAETREMSEDEVLGLISAKNIYIKGDGNWGPYNTVAALYGRDSLTFTKQNVNVKGSIISPQINFPQANFHLISDPQLPTFLPWSMPGRDTPILSIGAWSRQ